MHELGGTDDGIHRAGLDAQRAADADRLVDQRDSPGFLDAMGWIERLVRAAGQRGQCANARITAGRALVDVSFTRGDRLGIGLAARVLALATLRLGQQGVDLLDKQVDIGRHEGLRRLAMQVLAIEPNYPLFASAETIARPPAWCAAASCLLCDDEQVVGLA